LDLAGLGKDALDAAHGDLSCLLVSLCCRLGVVPAYAASWWRPAIRIEACRRETVSLAAVLPWLVIRFQTRSSSMRKRHSSVLPEAIFIICAGVSEAIMLAVSSEMPR